MLKMNSIYLETTFKSEAHSMCSIVYYATFGKELNAQRCKKTAYNICNAIAAQASASASA